MMRAVRGNASTASNSCGQRSLAALLLASLLGGCVYLPDIIRPETSYALQPVADGRIAGMLGAANEHVARGVVVDGALHALTARLDLIEAAQTSIDLQYFIWHDDPSGVLVIDRLLAAADRGGQSQGAA